MKNHRTKDTGRFTVEVEITNAADLVKAESGHLERAQIRHTKIRGIVDPDATRLVLPATVAKELGLPVRKQKIKVRYADGRRGMRKEVGLVHVLLQGREDVFSAIVEPKRDTGLIGAIVLEDLDFLVDCGKQRLVPRDPDFVVSEIE